MHSWVGAKHPGTLLDASGNSSRNSSEEPWLAHSTAHFDSSPAACWPMAPKGLPWSGATITSVRPQMSTQSGRGCIRGHLALPISERPRGGLGGPRVWGRHWRSSQPPLLPTRGGLSPPEHCRAPRGHLTRLPFQVPAVRKDGWISRTPKAETRTPRCLRCASAEPGNTAPEPTMRVFSHMA